MRERERERESKKKGGKKRVILTSRMYVCECVRVGGGVR